MNYRRVWTPQVKRYLSQEDQIILELVEHYGSKNWAIIANQLTKRTNANPRTGKQCRERWHNHLHPNIQKKTWTEGEQKKMFELHKIHGNKWTVIAQSLNGRTDNSIKNYFYSTIRRSLRRMGKFVGSKNSTGQMKKIKPSTLSKIFVAGTQLQEADQITTEEKQLLQYIKKNCQNVRDEIVHFVTYKPKRSDYASLAEKERYQNVINKMVEINEIYEKMKQEEKRKREQEQMFQKDYQRLMDQQSQDPESNSSDSEIDYKKKKNVSKEKVKIGKIKHGSMACIQGRQVIANSQNKQQANVVMMPKVIKSNTGNSLEELIDDFKNQEYQDPQFNIQLKQDFNFLLPHNMHNNNKSPGYFFNTPNNININPIAINPFNYFQSPSTPKIMDSYLNSLQGLSGLQNSTINQFQISIQKEIQLNLSKQDRKMMGSLSTIGSPGSAFRYCGTQ